MHLHTESWEVVDQKEVPQVPAYYDETGKRSTPYRVNNIQLTYPHQQPFKSPPSHPRMSFRRSLSMLHRARPRHPHPSRNSSS